ncbi:MAG: hypothetical protein ACE5JB_11005 [bacterium]
MKNIPVIKSSLELKMRTLDFNCKRYRERLKEFEKRYGMNSKEFLKQFKSGKLGDEPQWFEWEHVYEVYEESLKHSEKIKSIKFSENRKRVSKD